MKETSKKLTEIKKSIDTIIGVETILKRKKRTANNKPLEDFLRIISMLELLYVRSSDFHIETEISLQKYDEKFYKLIDFLLESKYGEKQTKLILFYVYERFDVNGNLVPLVGSDGVDILLEDPYQLYDLVTRFDDGKK